jgi:Ca2+-binding EF-hand superfamily protein
MFVSKFDQRFNNKKFNPDDIPNYDKIKVKENPMESVVKKLEEKGLDPKRAFYAFDEDCDEVLTVEEIKKGLKYHKVYLLDNEMRELVRAMDDNHDGVVSITEWENIL